MRPGHALRPAVGALLLAAAMTVIPGHPAPAAAGAGKATTRPVGSAPLTDAEAAARVRPTEEVRPENSGENSTRPTPDQLETFYAQSSHWGDCEPLKRRVTGGFTGTTDEIIQWVSWKWGIDEDIVRAQAATESWWRMSAVGDDGLSFGLMQVKRTAHPGTYPASAQSTAFNLDYYAGKLRYYFEGCGTWLNDVERGREYAAGDLWGSVGVWYSGRWYHNTEAYVGKVRDYLDRRVWEQPYFIGGDGGGSGAPEPSDSGVSGQPAADEASSAPASASVVLAGGPAADRLEGGQGVDIISGGFRDDVLLGRLARDFIAGDQGHDAIDGGAGSDVVDGGTGDDRIVGGGRADSLNGGADGDEIRSGEGPDGITGASGRDRLFGEEGDDRIEGGLGTDLIDGGPGDDNIVAIDGQPDVVRCGPGRDVVRADGGDRIARDCERVVRRRDTSARRAELDLPGPGTRAGLAVERILGGGSAGDRLEGGAGRDALSGGPGDDTLLGAGERDFIEGGPGADRLEGGGGSNVMNGAQGNDVLIGGPFADSLNGGSDEDSIRAGGGDDGITGASGRDRLYGEEGDDRIEGGLGKDLIDAGAGGDNIAAADGQRDTIRCGPGRDVVRADAEDRIGAECERVIVRRGARYVVRR